MDSIFSLAKNIPETLQPSEAVPLLIQAVEVGQIRGCFNITEAKVLHDAIKTIKEGEDVSDDEARQAKIALVVATERTQRSGNAFSLQDAALLFKAIDAIKDELQPKK